MALKAKWKGGNDGEYHAGIPSRDLTDEDWHNLNKDQKDTVLASKLYNVVGEKDDTDADRARHASRLENRVAREEGDN